MWKRRIRNDIYSVAESSINNSIRLLRFCFSVYFSKQTRTAIQYHWKDKSVVTVSQSNVGDSLKFTYLSIMQLNRHGLIVYTPNWQNKLCLSCEFMFIKNLPVDDVMVVAVVVLHYAQNLWWSRMLMISQSSLRAYHWRYRYCVCTVYAFDSIQ